jgi:hypothetical protein
MGSNRREYDLKALKNNDPTFNESHDYRPDHEATEHIQFGLRELLRSFFRIDDNQDLDNQQCN